MAAALFAVIVSSTQPTGALAALPVLAGHLGAGAIPLLDTTLAIAPLPAVPSDARALDAMAWEPRPAPVVLAAAAPAKAPAPARGAPARAAPARAAPARVVQAASRPARLWAQLRDGLTVTGTATWYFATRGYGGVPHVAMPGARYLPRGETAPRARICAGGRCTVVSVVDACACGVGTRRPRLIDVSATALRQLGLDPRRGVYQVRVTLLAR